MSHHLHNKALVLGLCALAATTMVTYALASGAAQSLLISTYGAQALPWAWLAVALGSAGVTWALSEAGKRLDIVRLFSRSCVVSGVSLAVLLLAHQAHVPHSSFMLFVWKDVYIIVLVELFWTFANVTFGLRSAPRIYGFFCAAGSMGSVAGGLVLGALSTLMGTANLMWLILPMLAVLGGGTAALARRTTLVPQTAQKAQAAHKAVPPWRNPYLLQMGALVALAQIMLTLTEFRFSTMLEANYPTEVARTHVIGFVSAIGNMLSFAVQLLSAQIFAAAGLQRTLLSLPWMLGAIFVGTLTQPGPITTSACQIAGKTVDYSLFRAAREMLYIPLSYDEKTRGKAFVDIFIYRVSRGGASMLLLALASRGNIDRFLGMVNVALAGLWLAVIVGILRRYRAALAARARGVTSPG